ncbi:hypothetical protein [Domibacillus iocasae]|uniref:Uncharacterized protein n=1 Tax=Domibacillus iocasae TaxID=1714016 RepID=A0A1E7DTW3_9BACI|nr:hypothetical protein [Domibacillus iocasae]OES46520.1 hypothetical protein BA724_00210 [Domibacillus iocasae]
MPGAEIMIRRIVYSLPETKYLRVWGLRIPWGVNWVDHRVGIYAGFDYPSVTPENQALIYECASLAGLAAVAPLAKAVAACQSGVECPDAIADGLPAADSILRETFFKCIESSGLPNDVKKRVDIGIYIRDE